MFKSTYQTRLESYKNGYIDGFKQKWDTRGPSMVSLARAFFQYDPCKGAEDQVICVNCKLKLSGWIHYRGNPIQRHAGLHSHCFVSQLGSLCAAITKGDNVQASAIRSACARSFENQANPWAHEGFISIPLNETQTDTVGCIQCLCFPQTQDSNPKHTKKCLLGIMLLRSDTQPSPHLEVKPFIEPQPRLEVLPKAKSETEYNANSDSSLLTKLLDPVKTELRLAAIENRISSSLPSNLSRAEMSEAECKSLFDLAKSDIRNEVLKHAARYESGLVAEIDNLEALEAIIIEHLETTHAKRIGLICSETERVAAKLIKEGTCMLMSN